MKLHKLAQATTMWLPGFAPDDASSNDAPAPLVQIEEPAPSLTRIGLARKVKPAAPPKEVWPALKAETLVSGTVTRFEANIAAMRTLKQLEAEGRAPTAEEAEVLTRFSGWGSFPQLFSWAPKGGEWDGRQEALRNVLDEKEIEAAKASTPNSHYTSPVVIEAMWQAVSRLGFKGGRVLEPSAGAGYFIGAMPTKLAQASAVTAVELDPVPARITKALYGRYGVKVLNEALEKTNLPDGFFDLVIGNVPFGNYPVSDAKGRWAGMSIHNYFILRALEMCREGGLVAVITSSYTLEASMGRKARAEMARLGELVSAVRLPMSAFRAVAGTDVTTDLLIFQRKAAPATAGAWVDSSVRVPAEMALNAYQAPHHNAYFGDHPEAVLGKVRYGGQHNRTLEVVFDGDLAEALAQRVAALPEGIVPEAGRINEVEVAPREVMVASAEWVKPGAYVVTTDGALAQSVDGQNLQVLSDLTTAKERRLRGIIPVRDALRELLAFQASSEDDALLERYQIALRASYEAFVKAFGPISKPFNTSAYRDDPDFPLLLSLEHWDAETGEATKADVFHKRTVGMRHRVERCETPEEALLVCLSENAKVVPSRIAELLTMDEDAAVHALLDAGLVFRNPMGARLEQSAIYLSGDVKTKLMQAEFAAEDDAEYLRNVEALKEVIPADIQAGDIGLKLGATWVPASVIVSFIGEALDAAIYTAPRVSYDKNAGTWKVSLNAPPKAQQEWATERVRLESLLDLAMNGQEPRVTDPDPNDPEGKKRVVNVEQTAAAKDRLEAIKSAFADWVWKDEARTELLVRIYNDRFNRIVRAAYDGSHLTLPGFSGAYVLRQHQSDAVWRCLVSGVNTLLAHVVGAGKTLTMICAGMEMRRTGMASKPCYVVPNHMLEQFAAEFLRAYPAASVLVANKDDMAPAKRKALLARMAVGNWDAVVMTHSSFERVPVPKDHTEAMIAGKIRDMELAYIDARSDSDTRAVKDLAKRKKVWQVRLERMAEGKGKDDLLDFAEVGFDALFVDEFHCFPYETPVLTQEGWKPIGWLAENMISTDVASVCLETGDLEWRPITDWVSSSASEGLVRVVHSGGVIDCTPDHEIWTYEEGYVEARSLNDTHTLRVLQSDAGGAICDEVLLETLRQQGNRGKEVCVAWDGRKGVPAVRCPVPVQVVRSDEQQEAEVLRKSLRSYMEEHSAGAERGVREMDRRGAQEGLRGANGRQVSSCFGEDARCESDAKPPHSGEGQVGKGWQNLPRKRGERSADEAAGDAVRAAGWSDGASNPDQRGQGDVRVSSSGLQGGHCVSGCETGNRGGWPVAQAEEVAISGSKKDGCAERSRVVSVAVLERAGAGGSGGSGRGGEAVYCLEVEGNSNFFAAGVLVSNCFKNLYRPTRMRMAGLPTNDSLRAFDMEIKTGYVMQRRSDGRGVVAATGTPIANSVSEMWVMQHYLQPQTLEAYGIEQFDTWAANFGESVTAMELAPDGGRYRINTRFARFVNVPELLSLFTEVADIKTGEMLDLPVPVAIREIVTAQPSETVKQYVRDLMDRVDAIKAGMVKPWEDNMLAVTTDGRKAATDIRLCNIDEDAPESKINLLVGKIMEIWSETAAKKGTQLVFLDAGTPQGAGWSLYADIRKKLVAAGMPEGEVAFIHDANTDKAKEALFESVRAGRVRVLLGSTAKMGTGTNVQTRLVAIHHADAPWRPADVEQRDGRGIRQGNTSASVRILRYVTAGTFDAYVWQTLETKAKFIGQVMRGDAGLRSIEDAEMGALSYAEVKAIASGNPLVIEKAGVDAEVMRLSMLKSAWMQRRANSASQVASLPGIIKRTEAAISAMKADAVAAAKMRDGLQMAVGARVLADEEQIAKRILAVAYSVEPGKVVKVGDIGPFTLHARGAFHSTRAPRCILQGGGEYEIEELGKTPRGVIAQIHGLLARIDSEVRHVEARLEERRETLSALRAALDVPFEHEENLNRLLARKAMIDAELCPTATETVDVGDELAMAA